MAKGIEPIVNELVKPKRTVGEDLADWYNEEFYKQANGNRDAFAQHHIDRFGIPRGSSRAKEIEYYNRVFDDLEKKHYPNGRPQVQAKIVDFDEGSDYSNPTGYLNSKQVLNEKLDDFFALANKKPEFAKEFKKIIYQLRNK